MKALLIVLALTLSTMALTGCRASAEVGDTATNVVQPQ